MSELLSPQLIAKARLSKRLKGQQAREQQEKSHTQMLPHNLSLLSSFSQWPAHKQQFTRMLFPVFKVLSVRPFLWKEQTPRWIT